MLKFSIAYSIFTEKRLKTFCNFIASWFLYRFLVYLTLQVCFYEENIMCFQVGMKHDIILVHKNSQNQKRNENKKSK